MRHRRYARRISVRYKIDRFREQAEGAQSEVQGLRRQAELAQEGLSAARTLLEKGLTPRPRVLELEGEASRQIAALPSKRSEIGSLRRSVAESESEIARLKQERAAGISQELAEGRTTRWPGAPYRGCRGWARQDDDPCARRRHDCLFLHLRGRRRGGGRRQFDGDRPGKPAFLRLGSAVVRRPRSRPRRSIWPGYPIWMQAKRSTKACMPAGISLDFE
jgi:hypothetical protein